MKKEILLLSYILLHLAVLVLLRSIIARKLMRQTQATSGDCVLLGYSSSTRRYGWFFTALLLLLLLAFFFCPWDFYEQLSWTEFSIGVGLLLAGSLVCWYYAIEAQFKSILVCGSGIRSKTPWSRDVSVVWDDVRSIWWIPVIENFMIRTSKGVIFVSPVLENLDALATQITSRVPREKWTRSAKAIKRAEKGPFRPFTWV